jgi:undecaprenyl diphosphate synthase
MTQAEHRTSLPRHIAIIMDGNGRWAKRRFMPRIIGHRQGVEAVRGVVSAVMQHGVEVLTLFAFSSENWRRPAEEVGLLMNLLMNSLDTEVRRLNENGVRLRFIGDRAPFSADLLQRINAAEALTAANHKLYLNIALNYGGRWDITEAARRLAERVERGELAASEISTELLNTETALHELPEPDLFIRTGGEQRISNFLLWQLAYTELYFTDLLWPDFNEAALSAALNSYAGRQRRFGRTGDQVVAEERSD